MQRTDNCYPLRQAKDAAKSLISRMLPGYDQVAIITYDYNADHIFGLSSNMISATLSVDSIGVHDDAPAHYLPWSYPNPIITDTITYNLFNPI